MVDKRPSNEIEITPPSFEEQVFEMAYKARDSWRKNQALWSVVVALVACAVGAWSFWAWKSAATDRAANRLLGMGLVQLGTDRPDSALASFDRLAADHGGLAVAKGSLFAGQIFMERSDWKAAEQRFRRALDESKGLPLLEGGARRGLAASLIEQQRYEEAEKELRKVVSEYFHTSLDVGTRELPTGPSDDLPGMALSMWQLVLVQDKIGRAEEARKTAETLIRAYPSVEEANDARRWLASKGLPYPA
ncbi:MAG: tetratricopeptide repeat protein [Fibrobacteria bacterium]|nr:tetratricopeptide repeat protein [Fibrobacteria bacterium]